MGKYKENPRYNVASCRLSDSEYAELRTIAAQYNASICSVVRSMVQLSLDMTRKSYEVSTLRQEL